MPYDIFGLGSSPFARHYLGNHYLFSLPAGTKMFQFPAFAFVTYCHKCRRFAPAGFPIRISTLQRLLAPQRGFSQLVTSFFAYESIHHTPFLFVIRLSSLTYTFRYISERKHTSAVFFFKTSDDLLSCFRLRIASSRPHCLFQYVIYRLTIISYILYYMSWKI